MSSRSSARKSRRARKETKKKAPPPPAANDVANVRIDEVGDWIVEFNRLSRWLRSCGYPEFASGIEVRLVENMPTVPNVEVELEAVESAIIHLAFLANDGPDDMAPANAAQFQVRLDKTTRIARRRQEDLRRQITSGETAIQAVQNRLEEISLLPQWETRTKKLWLGETLLRAYTRIASKQFPILDAFQAAGWPCKIMNLLKFGSLKDAIESLNDGLDGARLIFCPRDNYAAVEWCLRSV
jgi:hypothetical protein